MRKLTAGAVLAGAILYATPSWAELILLGGGDPLIFAGINTGSIVVASFADTTPGVTLGDLTATIDWGDGSASGGTVGAVAGHFVVTAAHTYSPNGFAIGDFYQEGNLDIAIAEFASNTASVLLNQAIMAAAGELFSGVVGTFIDSDPTAMASDFAATIDWGDGTMSTGAIVPRSDGGFDIVGSHTYAAPGSYAPSVALGGRGASLNAETRALVTVPEPGTLPVIATAFVLLAGALAARRRRYFSTPNSR